MGNKRIASVWRWLCGEERSNQSQHQRGPTDHNGTNLPRFGEYHHRCGLEQLEQRHLLAAGPITGSVFEDLDRDGIKDGGEGGLAGWTVELRRAVGSGDVLSTYQPNTPSAGDQFGGAIAPFGSDLLVGAPFEDVVAADDGGAAYLIEGTTGAQLEVFENPQPHDSDLFGLAIASVGGSVMVGAPLDDTTAYNSGSVYLFDAGTGVVLHRFESPTAMPGAQFGCSVAEVNGRILIGAMRDTAGGVANAGAAYLFEATAPWSLLKTFNSPTPTEGDLFGQALSAVGTDVLIGAYRDDTAAADSGAAYLFDATTVPLDGTNAPVLQTFTSPIAAEDSRFGRCVSEFDGNVLIGAPNDLSGAVRAGAVYVFSVTDGSLQQTYANPTPNENDQFGISVAAVNARHVLVGAHLDDAGGTDAGSAHLFDGNDTSLIKTIRPDTVQDGDYFGYSVTTLDFGPVGSVDLVGASIRADLTAENAGAVYHFGGIYTATTDALGNWAVPAAEPGDYTVAQKLEPGYYQSAPAAPGTYAITLADLAAGPPGLDFGNVLNTAPVAVDDGALPDYTGTEDQPLIVATPGVLINDTDIDGQPLTAILVAPPSHGALGLEPDGSFVYYPARDFFGVDGFTYVANDGSLDSNVATVTLTINATAELPSASDKAFLANEDTPLVVGVETAGPFATLDTAAATPVGGFATFSGDMYFCADDGINGRELWKTDGSAPTLVADINVGAGHSSPDDFVVYDNSLYFTADDGVDGRELWRYDGAQTTLAADINPLGDSFPSNLTLYDSAIYFSADDGVEGRELWKYDGAVATMAADIRPGVQSAITTSRFHTYLGSLYFGASDGVGPGETLWRFDGANASEAAQVWAGGPNLADPLAVYNGELYFSAQSASGTELWKFNGALAALAADINVGVGHSSPRSAVVYDGELYFSADDGTNGSQLWKYNGAAAALVDDVNPGGASPPLWLEVFHNAVYFGVAAPPVVYRYDGAATTPVTALGGAPDGAAHRFEGNLYFDADNGGGGRELWQILPSGALAYDTDPDGEPLEAVLETNVSDGALALNADGSFIYTPAANYHGTDSFTYRARDPVGSLSAIRTVQIIVQPINDAPVGAADAYSVDADTILNVPAPGVLANDTDIENDLLSAILDTPPTNGAVSLALNGAFAYSPGAGFSGIDTFTYRTSDGVAMSAPTTVTITVLAEPAFSIDDVSLVEGDAGTSYMTFTVTLSRAIPFATYVDYETANDVALVDLDYASKNGTLVFSPLEVTKTVNIPIVGETLSEPDETFFVLLSNPVSAVIADNKGIGTIQNDDPFVQGVEIEFTSSSGAFSVPPGGAITVTVTVIDSPVDLTGYQLAFDNSHVDTDQLRILNWNANTVDWPLSTDDTLATSSNNFVAGGSSTPVDMSAPVVLGTFALIAPLTFGDYLMTVNLTNAGAFNTGFSSEFGTVPIETYDDTIIRVINDFTPPTGDLYDPLDGGATTYERVDGTGFHYIDVIWSDPGTPSIGIDPATIDVNDITIFNTVPISVDSVVNQGGGIYRYYYDSASDGDALVEGDVVVTFVAGEVADLVGNTADIDEVESFTFNNSLLGVTSIQLNTDPALVDPADLVAKLPGVQPTNWATQRSDLRSITVTFNANIAPVTPADLVLTNLGVNAPLTGDVAVPLAGGHLSQAGNVLTITFSNNELADGIYELQLLSSITDAAAFPHRLDADGDGNADDYVFRGDAVNKFYKLAGDWNGDTGVSMFDWSTYAYWFGTSVAGTPAPEYVDLDFDGVIDIADWPPFLGVFALFGTFAAMAEAETSVPSVIPASGDEGVVLDLVSEAGAITFESDGRKVISVQPGTTIPLTPRVLSAPEALAGFQLNFSSSDLGIHELGFQGWDTASHWPMVLDNRLNSPNDTFIAAVTMEPVSATAGLDLGTFAATAPLTPGDYRISLEPSESDFLVTKFVSGERTLPIEKLASVVIRVVGNDPVAEIVDRKLFYNHSTFDGKDIGANALDDAAIAIDKSALFPGERASFTNYTSYVHGINGVMIDVAGMGHRAETIDQEDFAFRVGNSDNPNDWQFAPEPLNINVRENEGEGGSDRITIIWQDGAITNQWLEIKMVASENTGLVEDDVFFFGNAVGETGDMPWNALVTATDELIARHSRSGLGDPVAIDFPTDFNRDRLVNVTDRLIARQNRIGLADSLRLISTASLTSAAVGSTLEGSSTGLPYPFDRVNDWLAEYSASVNDSSTGSIPKRRAMAVDRLLASLAVPE